MRRKLSLLVLCAALAGLACSLPAPAAAVCTCTYCSSPTHANIQCWDENGEAWPCWVYAQNFC